MERFDDLVGWAARITEGAGILVIMVGAVAGAVRVFWVGRHDPGTWYELYRRYLGRAILLGLELLVAADIIRTITHVPDIMSVVALGLVVLIRTFLSFTLQLEVEGRWPWQPKPRARTDRP